jgi:hypothetical protein
MTISKRLSDAEANTKAGRLAGREAGINQPNSCDQESAFLTAAGEGEGITKANGQRNIDECDREWIDDWANDSEKNKQAQLVKAQYALSGGEVEPWESRSSCGEKRKKIDEYAISKRTKVNAERGYQLPEGDDAANEEQGTSKSSGRESGGDDGEPHAPRSKDRGRRQSRSAVARRQKRSASLPAWPSCPDRYPDHVFDFVRRDLLRYPDGPRGKVG